MSSEFEAIEAKTCKATMPLIVGITGPSFSGKTFSALELATGMRKVTGGDIYLMDCEAGRSLQYKDLFDFQFVKFAPPFSPSRYERGIDYCVAKGARIVIVDNMSLEHSGEGGVLDMVDAGIEEGARRYMQKYPQTKEWEAREKVKWQAQIAPKGERKSLNNKIEQCGPNVIFILLYRAHDKVKPAQGGGKPEHVGYVADTTSTLPYMMTVRFLLPPGSDGRPNLAPDTEFEKLSIKMPVQFRSWFQKGLQLNRDLGEKLARWSLGTDTAKPSSAQPAAREPTVPATTPPGDLATKEQAEEITMELRRLKMGRQAALDWLKGWGATSPETIPASKAISALQQLMARKDPS